MAVDVDLTWRHAPCWLSAHATASSPAG